MDADVERRLVERLKAGDESAFDLVYEAYRRPLFAFLWRLTRNRDAAEDALEDTWFRLVSRIDTVRDGARLGSWLFAVGRNLAISYLRAQSSSAVAVDNAVLADVVADSRPSPFDTVAWRELDRRLERGLAVLPIPLREVLLLVGVHGLSTSEAAAVCELSPAAFRQRLHRARVALARWLEDQDRTAPAARVHEAYDDR